MYVLLSILFTGCSAICVIFQPNILQKITESLSKIAIGNDDWNAFRDWLLILIGLSFGALVIGVLGTLFGTISSLLITQQIRSNIYKSILSFSFSDIDELTPSSIITRMTNDTQKIQMSTQMFFTFFIRSPITFIGGIINGFLLSDWYFGVIVLAISFIMGVVVVIVAFKAFKYFDKAQTSLDNTNRVIRENILGMRVVKSFLLSDIQEKRYKKENKWYRFYNIKAQLFLLPIMTIIPIFIQIAMVTIVYVAGGFSHWSNPDSTFIQDIFAYMQLLMQILGSFLMGIMVVVFIFRSLASIKRVNQVMDKTPSIIETKNPKPVNDCTITFKNVDFKPSKNAKEKILSNINLTIKPGQFVGIIGGTGSGKTALINLIPRLYDVNAGEVSIGGVNVKDISSKDLHELIAVVPQESFLFQGNLKENMLFGDQKASDEDIIKALKTSCAWDFVKEYKEQLKTPVDQRGRNFSGGQKQRLCIARALIKKSKITIFDNSTSALDLLTESKVQKNIRSNKNNTIIVVSQRVSSIKNADVIFLIDEGKIIGTGTHEQLLKNSVYKKIVDSQLGIGGIDG